MEKSEPLTLADKIQLLRKRFEPTTRIGQSIVQEYSPEDYPTKWWNTHPHQLELAIAECWLRLTEKYFYSPITIVPDDITAVKELLQLCIDLQESDVDQGILERNMPFLDPQVKDRLRQAIDFLNFKDKQFLYGKELHLLKGTIQSQLQALSKARIFKFSKSTIEISSEIEAAMERRKEKEEYLAKDI